MREPTVLFVSPGNDSIRLLQHILDREGYQVRWVETGVEALAELSYARPDLMLLDVVLPDMNGLDLCRYIKGDLATAYVPLIFVSAKDQDTDIIAGLEAGADDYVVRPFNPEVLLARMKAVLRWRCPELPHTRATIAQHHITIDPSRHVVFYEGTRVPLTATQFRILHFLASRPGLVCSREQIISAIKGRDCAVTERSVDTQIVALRKKLGKAGKAIKTVWGVGYRLTG